MKTISKIDLVALALVAGSIASQAQAETIVRFMPKGGVPYTYTVNREEPKMTSRVSVRPLHTAKHDVEVKTASKEAIVR